MLERSMHVHARVERPFVKHPFLPSYFPGYQSQCQLMLPVAQVLTLKHRPAQGLFQLVQPAFLKMCVCRLASLICSNNGSPLQSFSMACLLAGCSLLSQFTLLSSEKPGLGATASFCGLGKIFRVRILFMLNLKVFPWF